MALGVLWKWDQLFRPRFWIGEFRASIPLALLLSIDSESRHLVSFLPVLVIPVACASDRNPLRWAHVALFGALSVVFAKPWLIIGDDLQAVLPQPGAVHDC